MVATIEAYVWIEWLGAHVRLVVGLCLVLPLLLTLVLLTCLPKATSVAGTDDPKEVAPREFEKPSDAALQASPTRILLRERLLHTREALVGRLIQVVGAGRVDGALLDELEKLLFTADLGVMTAQSLLDGVRRNAAGGGVAQVKAVLKADLLERLVRVEMDPLDLIMSKDSPHVVLVLGVNGSGKTTTIGKLAAHYRMAGRSVILGAADTFRAAATEQLEAWAMRTECPIVKGNAGSDPAAVAFDTVQAAKSRDVDVALIDTAGRLQTKVPLMEELGKIVRVIGRGIPGAPHETLLILDANTGQNAISQARLFTEVADITGIVLTKLDGTAKGGVIVGLADEFKIPIRYIGVGEKVGDLRNFQATEFVDALFDTRES